MTARALASAVAVAAIIIVLSVTFVLAADTQAQLNAAADACREVGGVPHEGLCFHPGIVRDLRQGPRA